MSGYIAEPQKLRHGGQDSTCYIYMRCIPNGALTGHVDVCDAGLSCPVRHLGAGRRCLVPLGTWRIQTSTSPFFDVLFCGPVSLDLGTNICIVVLCCALVFLLRFGFCDVA